MTGRSYSTAVPSTLACMKKAPSPHTETQGRLGAANLAPSTPATPKPIGPNPIEPISESGRHKFVPFLAIAVDLQEPLLAGVGALVEIGAAIEFGKNLAQERAHIRHQ